MSWTIKIADGEKPEGHEDSFSSRRARAYANQPPHILAQALIDEAEDHGLTITITEDKPRRTRRKKDA